MNVDKQAVARLTDADIWDIQAHFDRALDTQSPNLVAAIIGF